MHSAVAAGAEAFVPCPAPRTVPADGRIAPASVVAASAVAASVASAREVEIVPIASAPTCSTVHRDRRLWAYVRRLLSVYPINFLQRQWWGDGGGGPHQADCPK